MSDRPGPARVNIADVEADDPDIAHLIEDPGAATPV